MLASAQAAPEPTAANINGIHLFSHVPEEIKREAEGLLQIEDLAAGERIGRRICDARCACFVIRGQVRVSHVTPGEREVLLLERGAGEFLGLFETGELNDPRLQLRAAEDTRVAFININDLQWLLERRADLSVQLMYHGRQVISALAERLVERSTMKVHHRIYAELLRLAGDDGSSAPQRVSRLPKQSDIAVRVGTQREAVTRELSRLEREGVITRCDGALVIEKPTWLREAIANC